MSRILIVIPSLKGVGGSEKLVDSLSSLLLSSHQVFQVSFDSPGSKRHFESNAPHFQLGPVPRLPLYLRWISYTLLALRLSRLKRKLKINVTISNLWGGDLISVLSFGKDKKVSLGVINIRGNPTNRLMIMFRVLIGFIYRRFDRVLAISRPLAVELKELYGLSGQRTGVFRNFVSIPNPSPVWGHDRVHRFVFCGRLVHEKNVDGLLSAWAGFARKRQDVQLVILGDGPLADDCRSLAERLQIRTGEAPFDTQASVLFLGTVKNPEDFMVGARAFVLSSRYEGVPTVLLLALSMGLPILSADCHSGGVRDLLGVSAQNQTKDLLRVDAGLLLPIPEVANAESLVVWKRAFEIADSDNEQHAQWVRGATELFSQYSAESVSKDWMAEVESLHRA
jgi:glycosyltransferase involved in cell wall biosynthesis